MRYIDKTNRCQDFDNYTKPNTWGRFNKNIKLKLKLHQHLLVEQQYLCIYCQQSIPCKTQKDNPEIPRLHPSHIEHIRPKSASQFPQLIFDYNNLSVSCNGFDTKKTHEKSRDFCGHPKDNNFDDVLFLHPCERLDIETCFEYDIEGHILPTSIAQDQAEYTLRLLSLDNSKLQDMRVEQYNLVLELTSKGELDIYEYLDPNQTELPKFYSMLKQFFSII